MATRKGKKKDTLPPVPEQFIQHGDKAQELQAKGERFPVAGLNELFPGELYTSVRDNLRRGRAGIMRTRTGQELHVVADVRDGQVFDVAAAIPRTPGRSKDFLEQLTDFTEDRSSRTSKIDLFHRVYEAEPMFSTGVNKFAALIATAGSFKVRHVRGKPGKGSDTRIRELLNLLNYWQTNLNSNWEDGIIRGTKGVKAFISRGARQALIEGDHFARQEWKKVKIPSMAGKAYSLPIVIQSMSSRNVEIIEEVYGIADLMYWVPPATFIQTLRSPRDPNVKEILDKAISPEVKSALLKDRKALLDPALMIHVRHRGVDFSAYGESLLAAGMGDLAYKKALQALDIVTIENLINRLVLLKVGSDNADSVYHKQEVTNTRLQMLQQLLTNVGPSAMILWPGPDLSVEEAGAHNQILNTYDRYTQVQERLQLSIGSPSALMSGETSGGKAAGWATIMAAQAQLQELQEEYAQMLTQIGYRIALENGFEDVDLEWKFHLVLLTNKTENATLILQQYALGLIEEETALEELGYSYEAQEGRMQQSVDKKYRDELFGPPRGQMTKNNTGEGGEGGGRPPTEKTGPDPKRNKEKTSPEEDQ